MFLQKWILISQDLLQIGVLKQSQPALFCSITHMAILVVLTCVMNVRYQSIQAFVTSFGPFCNRSCKFIHCACVLRARHRLSPSGYRGAPRGEHLSIRVRSYHDQLHGPIRFPHHFSVHDHGRQRSGRGPQHTFLPLRWPDCTSSRLRAEEYDRPVTQSIATPEPSSRTIPTLDRTLVAR